MKPHLISLLGVTALSCLLITVASCSDHQKDPANPTASSTEATPSPAVNPLPQKIIPPGGAATAPLASTAPTESTDVFNRVLATLETVTRDQASLLTPLPDQVNRGIDSQIAAWKARGGNSDQTSENKLALARTDFAQKIQTLSLASVETWKTAKSEAQASLENLRRAYQAMIAGNDQN